MHKTPNMNPEERHCAARNTGKIFYEGLLLLYCGSLCSNMLHRHPRRGLTHMQIYERGSDASHAANENIWIQKWIATLPLPSLCRFIEWELTLSSETNDFPVILSGMISISATFTLTSKRIMVYSRSASTLRFEYLRRNELRSRKIRVLRENTSLHTAVRKKYHKNTRNNCILAVQECHKRNYVFALFQNSKTSEKTWANRFASNFHSKEKS